MSRTLELIREKKKQRANDLSYFEQEFETLNVFNNQLVLELKNYELNRIEQDKILNSLSQELDLLEDTLIDLVDYLVKSSDELTALIDAKRPLKREKKLNKKKDSLTRERPHIDKDDLDYDIKNIKKMVGFLMSEYKKQLQKKS